MATEYGHIGSSSDVEALWRAIQAVPAPAPTAPPPFHSPTARPSAAGVAVMLAVWRRRLVAAGLIASAGAGLAFEPSATTAWAALGVMGAYLAVSLPKRAAEVAQAARGIEEQYRDGLRAWWEQGSSAAYLDAEAELEAARAGLSQLGIEERRRIDADPCGLRAGRLQRHLRRSRLSDHKIKGVGPRRLARLASHGVESADDLLPDRVLSVPGIGPVTTRALLSWRERIEDDFVYDPEKNPRDRARIAAIRDDIAERGAPLHAQLADGPRRLADLAAAVDSRRRLMEPQLHELHARWLQASADLRICGRQPGPPPAPPTRAARWTERRRGQVIATARPAFA